jgi:Family of unknown function (DUF5683)
VYETCISEGLASSARLSLLFASMMQPHKYFFGYFFSIAIFAFLASIHAGFGQTRDTTERAFVPLETMRVSTIASMTKSPTEALIKSIIPGWGQIYVESYWKASIFFGGAVYCVTLAIVQNDSYNRVQADTALQRLQYDSYLRQREFYRDTRDAFIIAAAAVWAISAIDAYTGAHLFDFDVSDEIPKDQKQSHLQPLQQPPRRFHITPYLDPLQLRVGVAVQW